MTQIPKSNFSSISQMTGQLLIHRGSTDVKQAAEAAVSFQDILSKKQTVMAPELKFSRHANERLASRNIDLSGEQIERLANGTNKAREKGIQESLVMVDNLAFIVNIKNNTVVTAVKDTDEAIFTNIDGAVIS